MTSKFFKIWRKNILLSVSEMMTHKIGFFLLCLSLFFGDIIIPLVSTFIYKVSSGIPGWTLMQFILFQGTLILVLGLWHLLFADMPFVVIHNVMEGTFDNFLLRPFPALKLLTTMGFDFDGIGEVMAGVLIVGIAFISLKLKAFLLVYYILFVLVALLFQYSLTIIAASLSFIFVQSWRLVEIIDLVSKFSRYPINIYNPETQFVIKFIVPAAIASYYPASILLGIEPLTSIVKMSIPVFVFFLFSLLLWNFAIKKYTSAGG